MFYIVGLGNPGEKYKDTRHNAGWLVLDAFCERFGFPNFVDSSKYAGMVSEGVVAGKEVALLKPQTYMNKSGSSVKKLVPKGGAANLVLMYDDIDLGIGDVKVSIGKGAGGHNGVQSVIDALDTKDFIRIRIGIAGRGFFTGKPKRPQGGTALSNRVLGSFTSREQQKLDTVAETVSQILETIVTDGVEQAMNKYN